MARNNLQQHVCTDQDRVILKLDENGDPNHNHFILVTGQQANGGTDWTVFDPGWNPSNTIPMQNIGTLQGHLTGFFTNNGSTSLGTFRSFQVSGARVYRDLTQPILGGITISANSPVELLLRDPVGRLLGNTAGGDVYQLPNGSYTRDFPIADDAGTGIAHGDPTGVKVASVLGPAAGPYQLTVTGTALGTFVLTSRFAASDGTSQVSSLAGITNIGNSAVYEFQYSLTPGQSSPVVLLATLHSTFADISDALQLGLIDNAGIANALSAKINAASDAAARGDSATASNVLNAFKNQVNAQTGKHITGVAPQMLQEDADSLVSQLP